MSDALSCISGSSSVEIKLSQKALLDIMPAYGDPANSSPAKTKEAVNNAVQFFTYQSLVRDGFTSAYCTFLPQKDPSSDDELILKITSPRRDVSRFAKELEVFFQTGTAAVNVWNELKAVNKATGVTFSLELGLPFFTQQSVMLLHYPPSSTKSFSNFLYAPTIARWYCLLAQNDVADADIVKQTRIVDILPLVAASTAGSKLAPFNGKFDAYSKKNLAQFLPGEVPATAKQTLPMGIFGEPVRAWVWATFKDQIEPQIGRDHLEVLDVFTLSGLVPDRPDQVTPCIVANHPSEYLYDTHIPIADWKKKVGKWYPSPYDVCHADLISAGWNAIMAKDPQGDFKAALAFATERWKNEEDVKLAMIEQNTEFYPTNESEPKNSDEDPSSSDEGITGCCFSKLMQRIFCGGGASGASSKYEALNTLSEDE